MDEEYWENRYASGGTSGPGSIGAHWEWKWKVINVFLPTIDHLIDVGCGDLTFWKGRECKDYIGIDISETIINRNRIKRPAWSFIKAPAQRRIDGLKKEVVFCLGLLFHVMNSEIFLKILNNLCYYSTDFIFIYTWMNNPFTLQYYKRCILHYFRTLNIRGLLATLRQALFYPYTDEKYQFFRPLEKYLYVFDKNGFKLVKRRKNPDKIGALYVFKKQL